VTFGRASRNAATEEFFDGTAQETFLIRRCTACARMLRPQSHVCECGGTDLEWVPAAGRASLASWVVIPSFDGGSIVAIGQLEEGPWWWAALRDADPDTLVGGAALEIRYDHPEDSEVVPYFVPAAE
jgi:uncharacterized OB-fold protein